MQSNPHTKIPPYKFNNPKKKEIDIVINMKAACAMGVEFWTGDQNAIMTEHVVRPACIIQARRINGVVLGVKKPTPFTYPPLERLAHPRTLYEIVDAVPAKPKPQASHRHHYHSWLQQPRVRQPPRRMGISATLCPHDRKGQRPRWRSPRLLVCHLCGLQQPRRRLPSRLRPRPQPLAAGLA